MSESEHAERERRLKQVIDELIDLRATGKRVTDEEVCAHHPSLMPELEQRLAWLRRIESAAKTAQQQIQRGELDAEIRCLQQGLPEYELIERLDVGGQGVVFRAHQISAKRDVAIKVLLYEHCSTDRRRYRFEREVEVTSRLRHPNIVALHNAGLVHGRPYFVMDLIEGLALDDYVRVEILGVREVVSLVIVVCRAVDYAHQRGVIHRDLKPANILIDLDGQPRVLDFGLALDSWAASQNGKKSVTMDGQCLGTLPYISPEQARFWGVPPDVRTDLYALGVILFRLITGMYPYSTDGDPAEARENILSCPPMRMDEAISRVEAEPRPGIESLNDDLESVIHRVLAKDPEERYRSVADFADDLERYLNGEAVLAKADRRAYVALKTLKKYRRAVTVAATFVLMLSSGTVALGILWHRASEQRDIARDVARAAYQMFQRVSGEIDDRVAKLGGGLEIRDEMLSDLVADLQRLTESVRSDAALSDLQAALEEKLGDVARALGSQSEAIEHYQAFSRLSHESSPDGPVRSLSLARAQRKLGEIADDYEPHFSEAIRIGGLIQASDDSHRVIDELSRARLEYVQRLLDFGRYKAALGHTEAALEMLKDDAENHGRLLARAYSSLGIIQTKLGVQSAAIESLEKAYRLRSELSDRFASDVTLRRDKMLASLWLGDLVATTGDTERAIHWYEEAVRLGEHLTFVDPSRVQAKRELYAALHRLAHTFLRTGDTIQARFHGDAAFAIAEESSSSGDKSYWQRQLAYTEALHGRILYAEQQWSQARERFQRALSIRETSVKEQPDEPELQAELAHSHEWLGDCERKARNRIPAVEHYEEACRLRGELFRSQPDVASRAYEFSLTQLKLAGAQLDLGGAKGTVAAAELLNKAESRVNQLRNSGRFPLSESGLNDFLALLEFHRKRVPPVTSDPPEL